MIPSRPPIALPPDSAAVTVVMTALMALASLSIDMTLPALPRITEGMGAEVATGQLVVSVFLLGFAVGQLIYGPLSDRFGRRPVLLGGIGLYCAAGLGCFLAPSIHWLLGARCLQGVGACAGQVLVRAVVRDISSGQRAARILSVATAGSGLAPILAPIIGGGMVMWFDWRAIFAVLAGIGVLMVIAVWLCVMETNRHLDPRAISPASLVANYAQVFKQRSFLGYTFTLAGGAGGLFSFISGSPFVLISLLGLAPYQFGLSFATVMLGSICGALASSRLAMRWGVDRSVLFGLACFLVGGISMAVLAASGVAHVAAVIIPMTVFMFGHGLVMPNSMAGAIEPFGRMAGAASALLGFLQMVVGSLAGAAVGHLHDGTPRPMAMMIAGSGIIGALCFWRLIWRPSARRLPAGSP